MNRRDFCRYASAAGGAVLLSPLANACSPWPPNPTSVATHPAPTSPSLAPPSATDPVLPTPVVAPEGIDHPTAETAVQPTDTPAHSDLVTAAAAVSHVVLVKDDDRARGVAKALALLDPGSLMGRDVLLKPNFNSADPSPGSTHPEILRAILSELKAMDAGQITLVDRSGMGSTRKVMEQVGVYEMIPEFNCRAVVLDELAEDEWTIYRHPGLHWQDGFPIPRLLADADVVIQTCNLKTHRYGGHFTMSLKNSVGFVAKTVRAGGHDYMTELHGSPHQRLMIAEINAAYQPELIIMDGIEAFVSGGPANGQRANPGVILAGRDRVAMDAAGVAILRMFGTTREVGRGPVFDQQQIARAAELGLGAARPDQIEFITADAESTEFAQSVKQVLLA